MERQEISAHACPLDWFKQLSVLLDSLRTEVQAQQINTSEDLQQSGYRKYKLEHVVQ